MFSYVFPRLQALLRLPPQLVFQGPLPRPRRRRRGGAGRAQQLTARQRQAPEAGTWGEMGDLVGFMG